MFKRFWWMLLVMVPIGAMLGLGVMAVVTYTMPKQFESEATIEVRQSSRLQKSAPEAPEERTVEQSARTVAQKLKSRKNLERVVDNLDLANRWAVDKDTAVQTLEKIVFTEVISGTDLIAIRARFTNNEVARDIAEFIVISYRNDRQEAEEKAEEQSLETLRRKVRNQEDKVEERRRALTTLARQMTTAEVNSVPQTDQKLKQEKSKLELQIRNLRKFDGEPLIDYASALKIPGNVVHTFYRQYRARLDEIEILELDGLGKEHPTMIAEIEFRDGMKLKIDKGIVSLRKALQERLQDTNERLEKEEKKNAIPTDIFGGGGHNFYLQAKQNLETDQAILKQLKLKEIEQSIRSKIPSGGVSIHEMPVLAHSPVSPNVPLNLVLGTAAGFLLGPLMALPLMWLMNRVIPSAGDPAGKTG